MINSILNRLSEVAERFQEIEILLGQPDVTKDQSKYISLSKEYSDLSPIVSLYREVLSVEQTIEETLSAIRARKLEWKKQRVITFRGENYSHL